MLEIFILTCVIFKDSVESEKPYELKEENKILYKVTKRRLFEE